MNIIVHDFAGHPGQLQLSRELARRGHNVRHDFCESVTTGKGATSRRKNDPTSFSVKGIALGREFARYSPLRRVFQEVRYGWLSTKSTLSAKPDVAIFSNMPVVPLAIVSLLLRTKRVPFIFWWQDVYSDAVGTIARKRLGIWGSAIASVVERIEAGIAKRAAAIVPIAEAFTERLEEWNIDQGKVFIIPNWGAVGEVSPRPRHNAWSAARDLDRTRVAMYAGTLGLKHDPSVLAELARSLPEDCRLVVVSEGQGRQWLEQNRGDCANLMLFDYQSYDDLPDMLASADVVLAILEEDASRYSVPSKVLNYLCAGRPVLALLPSDNSVAKMVEAAEAGVVVPPGANSQAAQVLNRLLADPALCQKMGANGRRFAERTFEISLIGDRFEGVISYAVASNHGRQRPSKP